MKEKLSALIKGSAILVLSNVCIKAINFFLLPLYTAYLTPEQLGISDTVTTLISLVYPILVLGMDSAFSAFYYDREEGLYQRQVFSTSLAVLTLTSLLPLLLVFFAGGLSELIFDSREYGSIVILALLSVCCTLWCLPFSLLLRIRNRMGLFAVVNTVGSLVTIFSNIITVTVLGLEESALIVSYFLTNFVMLLLYLVTARQKLHLREVDPALAKRMLKYSLPLVPMVVSSWILTTSDTLILKADCGEASVGIYGVATRFVNVVNVFTSAVYTAYTTFAFSSKNEENSKETYVILLDVLQLFLLAVVFTVSIFSREILSLMTTGEEYATAYLALPALLFSQVFYAANTIVGYGLSFEKKSNYMLLAVTGGAVVNLVLNLIFIPRGGIFAAALTTWIGNLVMLFLTARFSAKVCPCPYHLRRLMGLNIAFTAACVLSLPACPLWGRAVLFVVGAAVLLYAYRQVLSLGWGIARTFLKGGIDHEQKEL